MDRDRAYRYEEGHAIPGPADTAELQAGSQAGDLYVFRGRRGDLCKILWHDGIGMSLYAKRLERGKYIWPSAVDGVIAISASQLACMLEAIDWRNPQATWRPTLAG